MRALGERRGRHERHVVQVDAHLERRAVSGRRDDLERELGKGRRDARSRNLPDVPAGLGDPRLRPVRAPPFGAKKTEASSQANEVGATSGPVVQRVAGSSR